MVLQLQLQIKFNLGANTEETEGLKPLATSPIITAKKPESHERNIDEEGESLSIFFFLFYL